MKLRMRGAAAIAIGAFGLALGGSASADEGTAVLEAKDDSSVTMNGLRYRVSDRTVLESKDGGRMTLADLPTLADGASADDAAVWYEADDASAPTAHRIKLTGSLPE